MDLGPGAEMTGEASETDTSQVGLLSDSLTPTTLS